MHSRAISCVVRSVCPMSVRTLSLVAVGTKYTADYKNYAVASNKVISWMHDVPLDLNPTTREANMVVEVPRWSNGKFEIDIKTPALPIVQDVKKGKMRFVGNVFPHKGYIHNYGAFPQTWEDPDHKDAKTGLFGDNDPLDVCEIGLKIHPTGLVVRVKILGAIALIDDGELDWKVMVVATDDPLAASLNDVTTSGPSARGSWRPPDGGSATTSCPTASPRTRLRSTATFWTPASWWRWSRGARSTGSS